MQKQDDKAVLTPEQIDLAAKYLAMSNLGTLDWHRKDIKDLTTLKNAVHYAWEDAVTGTMEGMEGGYDDRNESKATDMVQGEIDRFKNDLLKGGKKAAYWIAELRREIPFFFEEQKRM